MRGIGAGIGLISILLAAGVIFYLTWGGPGNAGSVRPALEAKRDAEELTNTISGRDSNKVPVTESITYETTPKGIVVKSVIPGGALDVKYGLKPGDIIVELGPLPLEQWTSSDGAAKDFMMAAYGRPDAWVVRRGSQKLTLPQDRNVGAAPATPSVDGSPAVADPSPANPNPNEGRGNARKQAQDLMKKIEQH